MSKFKSKLTRASASVAAAFALPCPGKLTHSSREGNPEGLIVADAFSEDDSIVEMSPATTQALRLSRDDIVFAEGQKGKKTILVVLCGDSVDYGTIRMTRIARRNLCVEVGDRVTVRPCSTIEYAKRVSIVPAANAVDGANASLFELFDVFLIPHFRGQYRPLRKGDMFTCRAALATVDFAVVDIDPPECGIVSDDTEIYCSIPMDQVPRAGKCRHVFWSLYTTAREKLRGLGGGGPGGLRLSSPLSSSRSSSKEALLAEYRTLTRHAF